MVTAEDLVCRCLALVKLEGLVFSRHVIEMLESSLEESALIQQALSDSSHILEVDRWRSVIEKLEGLTIDELPVSLTQRGANLEDLATLAISELVHRKKWDQVMSRNPDTELFLTSVIRARGMN